MVPGRVRYDSLFEKFWAGLAQAGESVEGSPRFEGADPLRVLAFEEEVDLGAGGGRAGSGRREERAAGVLWGAGEAGEGRAG